MSRPGARLFVLLASLAMACGKESGPPSLPPGPHGGHNTVQVVLGGKAQDFQSVWLSLTGSSTGTLTLHASGGVYPDIEVKDGGYSLVLEVHIDPSELAKLTLPADVAIGGTARFPSEETAGPYPPPTFEPASGASPVVTSLFFSAAVGCYGCAAPFPAGAQHHQGRLQIVANDATAVQGSLHLDISGLVPIWDTSSTSASIDVVFDLAITSGS